MKKIFALLLVALMLLPCFVACGSTPGGGTTTDSGNNGGTQGGGNNDEIDESLIGSIKSKDTVLDKWSGKTLKILATTWASATPGAPWSQAELTVKKDEWFKQDGFGQRINDSILTRAARIKELYGVELEFINAGGSSISNLLTTAIATPSSTTNYHIAMPRMMEAQTLVSNQVIYDISKSLYIDFDDSYFSNLAKEAYTVHGHTFFAAGDFSFLDEQTSYLIFYNAAIANGIDGFPNLYEKVKEGKWTIDEMIQAARLYHNDNGETSGTNIYGDDDTYGFGTTTLSQFFQTSGIQQVSVNKDTQKYEITLNNPKVSTLIEKIRTLATEKTWSRTSWTGGYGAMELAFNENRLLFYSEVVQKFDQFKEQTENFKVSVLPCPKLEVEQEHYYTPCSYQSTLISVPKTTDDRDMSEYFVDVLSWTGQEYIMKAYKEDLKSKMDPATADKSIEIIETYVFPNLCYDVGYMHGWDGLMTNSVQGEVHKEGSNFTNLFDSAKGEAGLTVANWNTYWEDYEE